MGPGRKNNKFQQTLANKQFLIEELLFGQM